MKSYPIIFLLFAVFPSITSAQERGHMQYGVNLRGNIHFFQAHSATNFMAGWRFNEKRYLGLGTGLDFVYISSDEDPSNGKVPAIPLYLDYRRYVQV